MYEDPDGGELRGADVEEVLCGRCGDGEDEPNLMLCDGCDQGYHCYCVGLESVPLDDWFCPMCVDSSGGGGSGGEGEGEGEAPAGEAAAAAAGGAGDAFVVSPRGRTREELEARAILERLAARRARSGVAAGQMYAVGDAPGGTSVAAAAAAGYGEEAGGAEKEEEEEVGDDRAG